MASFEPSPDHYLLVDLADLPYARGLKCGNYAVLDELKERRVRAVRLRRGYARLAPTRDAAVRQAAARDCQQRIDSGRIMRCREHDVAVDWERLAADCERLLADVRPWSKKEVEDAAAAVADGPAVDGGRPGSWVVPRLEASVPGS